MQKCLKEIQIPCSKDLANLFQESSLIPFEYPSRHVGVTISKSSAVVCLLLPSHNLHWLLLLFPSVEHYLYFEFISERTRYSLPLIAAVFSRINQPTNLIMFASLRFSPVVSNMANQISKRYQSSIAASLSGMNGRHFLSIDELRYVRCDQKDEMKVQPHFKQRNYPHAFLTLLTTVTVTVTLIPTI